MMLLKCFLLFILGLTLIPGHYSRIHHLSLTNDIRRYFSVSTFGFFQGGRMSVDVQKISFYPEVPVGKFGFSLTRTLSNSVTPYLESHQETCLLLDDTLGADSNVNILTFVVNSENNAVVANCTNSFRVRITFPNEPGGDSNQRSRRNAFHDRTSDSFLMRRKKRQQNAQVEPVALQPKAVAGNDSPAGKVTSTVLATQLSVSDAPVADQEKPAPPEGVAAILPNDKHDFVQDNKGGAEDNASKCAPVKLPLKMTVDPVTTMRSYSFKFDVEIVEENQGGLYMLYFHNCANYGGTHAPTSLNLSISINEHNEDSYLSAGEIPLPQLYFIMSVTFFCLGCGWIYVLRRKSNETFKIHYLMGLLIFVKSLSLLFHGINYYFIARDGYHIEAWAVMYYITHLLKGALLFITIVLIGTGWAFIKHILSDKDKKIFMIVIPLQVLANVAEIIMEESEEGETQHNTWREVFILVDLLCCGAILFPVVWSIRHLQDASQTDGKALINLEKLKVFRHFYVMIVCYIYFTRIIVFLLKITVPFQYEWLDEFFREIATLVFFLVTGYKFRPTYSNPYFRLSQDEDPREMEEVVTQSGLTEQVYKTRRSTAKEGASPNTTTKRESSHEYD